MTTDRDLLTALVALLNAPRYIEGDKTSIGDMVKRYGNPPLTRAYPIAMKLTRAEYLRLGSLLQQVNARLANDDA
jgi:hypothetical protein